MFETIQSVCKGAVESVVQIVKTLQGTDEQSKEVAVESGDQQANVDRSFASTNKTKVGQKRSADDRTPNPSAKKVKFSKDTPDQTDAQKEAAYKAAYEERLRQEAAVPGENDKQVRCSRADAKDAGLTPDQQIAHENMCKSLSVDDRIGMELREKFGKWEGPNHFNKEALELDISSCLELLYDAKTTSN